LRSCWGMQHFTISDFLAARFVAGRLIAAILIAALVAVDFFGKKVGKAD
jgi:hypothetical protein